MNDYAFDNRTLARQVLVIPPMKFTVCYSSAHYVRVVTISCSVIGRSQCARDGA